MNNKKYQELQEYLTSIKDPKYQEFTKKLTITKYEIIGIRIPILRNIAKSIKDEVSYLEVAKDNTFEEVMLQGLVISKIKDEKLFDNYFNKYISKIDNWSLCDTFCNSIKIVKSNPNKYFKKAIKLSLSNKEYNIRVGLIIILNYFIELQNVDIILNTLDRIDSTKYYVNMAISWLLCEMYIKYPDKIEEYLKHNNLNKFTQNKTISKINDSYRVEKEKKEYLKTLKK